MKESKTYNPVSDELTKPFYKLITKQTKGYQDQTRVDSVAGQTGNAGGLKVVMAAVQSQRNLNLIGTPRSKRIKARILGTKKLPLTF